jgi:hypothetical protein
MILVFILRSICVGEIHFAMWRIQRLAACGATGDFPSLLAAKPDGAVSTQMSMNKAGGWFNRTVGPE